MNINEAVDWQVPSEWKRRLWIGNEKMFRAYDVMKIEIFFEHFSSINAEKKKKKKKSHVTPKIWYQPISAVWIRVKMIK